MIKKNYYSKHKTLLYVTMVYRKCCALKTKWQISLSSMKEPCTLAAWLGFSVPCCTPSFDDNNSSAVGASSQQGQQSIKLTEMIQDMGVWVDVL